MNRIIFLLSFFCILSLSAQQRKLHWSVPVEAKYVENFYKIDEGVYRSAQPDAVAFSELEQTGIREVLNLRFVVADDKYAGDTDLILHHVKMMASDCDWDKLVETLQIIKNRKGPIVIHCKHGADRTGLVVALYRLVFQNWDKEDAIDELKNGEHNFHKIYANIPSFIRNVDVDRLKEIVFEGVEN